MAYLLILWTYNLRNLHEFESQNPRTKKFGLDSIVYRASQLRENVQEEIRNPASLLIFKESIKTIPLIFCLCYKLNLVYLNLTEYILVPHVQQILEYT